MSKGLLAKCDHLEELGSGERKDSRNQHNEWEVQGQLTGRQISGLKTALGFAKLGHKLLIENNHVYHELSGNRYMLLWNISDSPFLSHLSLWVAMRLVEW